MHRSDTTNTSENQLLGSLVRRVQNLVQLCPKLLAEWLPRSYEFPDSFFCSLIHGSPLCPREAAPPVNYLDQLFVLQDRKRPACRVPGNPVLLHQCCDAGKPGPRREVTRGDSLPQDVRDLPAWRNRAVVVNRH